MDTSDLLSTLAIVISLGTFFLTWYYQYGKPSQIKLVVGDQMRLVYAPHDAHLKFWLNLTFFNEGARGAAVVRVEGSFSRVDSPHRCPLHWVAFIKSQNIAEPGKLKRWSSFDRFPETIVVPAYSAETRCIAFQCEGVSSIEPGNYAISFVVVEGPLFRKVAEIGVNLPLTTETTLDLTKALQDEDGVFEESLMVTLGRQNFVLVGQ